MMCEKEKKYLLIGIIPLFIIGSTMHFAYDLLNNYVVAIFAPVNESIFEHLKLLLWPLIFWWGGYYLTHAREIDANRWFTGLFCAILFSMLFVALSFYFLRYAFDIESIILDILIYFLSLVIGQIVGYHLYNKGHGIDVSLSLGFIVILIILFITLTFYPPMYDFFKDYETNTFGIWKVKG